MTEIDTLLYRLGFRRHYRGYPCLVKALELTLQNPDLLLSYTKQLYPEVAARLDCSASNVEHNLRTLISAFWKRGDRAYLEELAKYSMSKAPAAGELIDILAAHLMREPVSP